MICEEKLQPYFLIFFMIGALALTFFILYPFFYALIFALIFLVIFKPLHKKILNNVNCNRGLSSFFMTLLVIVFILTPLIFLVIQISKEAKVLYDVIANNGYFYDTLNSYLQKFSFLGDKFSLDIQQYLKSGLSLFLNNLGTIFSNSVKLLMNIVIFLISLYYLFKDGSELKKTIITFSPLTPENNKFIFDKIENTINSVIKGRLAIAFAQGILTAIGFLIFGIENAVLWGTIATVMALIPGVGTAVIFIPVSIFLYFTTSPLYGLGIFLWGILLVGTIDNILGPKIIGEKIQIHPFIIFLSVLGGIIFWGPIGFLLGPLTISLLFSFIDIYFLIFHHLKSNTNLL